MPDRRITSVIRTSTGVAVSEPCLVYGVVLSGKGGNASAVLCNVASGTAVALSTRVLPLYKGAPTGTVECFPPLPRYMSAGCFVSMGGAVSHVVVFYNKRD